jgi:hypothetical protein
MERKTINLNDRVRIKLRPAGLFAYNLYILGLRLKPEDYPLPIDKDGYVEMHLWEVMMYFGTHCHIGTELPMETEIEILERNF